MANPFSVFCVRYRYIWYDHAITRVTPERLSHISSLFQGDLMVWSCCRCCHETSWNQRQFHGFTQVFEHLLTGSFDFEVILVGGLVAINSIFPYIGNVIIPMDFHIFQRGGPTTNQSKCCRLDTISTHLDGLLMSRALRHHFIIFYPTFSVANLSQMINKQNTERFVISTVGVPF